jgi:hypothetical protein
VTVLKNSQVVATTTAERNGDFQVPVSGLASGRHSFSVYATDAQGNRSAALVFPVSLTRGIVSKVEALFLPPTLHTDKVQVKQSESLTFSGQTTPVATVEIMLNNETFTATAGQDGQYSKQISTIGLPMGAYTATAQAVRGQQRSEVSTGLTFKISTTTILVPLIKGCVVIGDLNKDCRVNLVDFSILAFWYQRTLTPEIAIREKEHLSGDGKINIIDFSIMAFHWTG